MIVSILVYLTNKHLIEMSWVELKIQDRLHASILTIHSFISSSILWEKMSYLNVYMAVKICIWICHGKIFLYEIVNCFLKCYIAPSYYYLNQWRLIFNGPSLMNLRKICKNWKLFNQKLFQLWNRVCRFLLRVRKPTNSWMWLNKGSLIVILLVLEILKNFLTRPIVPGI